MGGPAEVKRASGGSTAHAASLAPTVVVDELTDRAPPHRSVMTLRPTERDRRAQSDAVGHAEQRPKLVFHERMPAGERAAVTRAHVPRAASSGTRGRSTHPRCSGRRDSARGMRARRPGSPRSGRRSAASSAPCAAPSARCRLGRCPPRTRRSRSSRPSRRGRPHRAGAWLGLPSGRLAARGIGTAVGCFPTERVTPRT